MASTNQGTATPPKASKNAVTAGVHRAYTAQLTATTGGNRIIDITTPLPKNYQFQLSSNWDNPFAAPLQDMAGRVGSAAGQFATAATGVTSRNKYLSSAVWEGGSMLKIAIPFVLFAQEDEVNDVLKNMRDMMKLVAPTEDAAGFLHAPGPTLNTAYTAWDQSSGDLITIRIGDFFTMTPCVIDDVSCDFDTQMGQKGAPMNATITVSATSFWTVSRKDIDGFFRSKLASA